MAKIDNISIENAKIVFRNLSGKPTDYNPAGGQRGFAVVISDPEFAKNLIDEGWNVRQFSHSDDDEEPEHYLKVKVSYKTAPPHIWLCTKRGKTLLTEETVGSIDYAEITGVDVIISPYAYTVRGEFGIAAYVKTMYVNVVEDEFADKYRYDDMDEIPFN